MGPVMESRKYRNSTLLHGISNRSQSLLEYLKVRIDCRERIVVFFWVQRIFYNLCAILPL